MCENRLRSGRVKTARKIGPATTSIIARRSLLEHLKNARVKDKMEMGITETWHPRANLYYSFAEDTNPFTRVKEFISDPCECAIFYGMKSVHESLDPFTDRDPYYEVAAWKKYLLMKPTCFVIFAKPGLNGFALAKMIADYWHCLLISPETVIQEEIDRKSSKGCLLEEILRNGKSVGAEMILDLMESRAARQDVLHRGYVLQGIPLIANQNLDYSSYPYWISGDESEESISKESKETCFESEDKLQSDLSNQIEQIFTVWSIAPTVIIYSMCPEHDIFCTRENLLYNPYSGNMVDILHRNTNMSDPEFFSIDIESYFDKHLLKRLSNSRENIRKQSDIYRKYALPFIDRRILIHDPQYVIRVNGRSSVTEAFDIIRVKLKMLPLSRVILPKKMSEYEMEQVGEDSPRQFLNFEGKTLEESFRILSKKGMVVWKYAWKLSAWNYFCPVALAQGQTVEGKPKHAVRFLSEIYFLSSSEAEKIFLENPRPFLVPPNPRPSCKIAILGVKHSGIDELSDHLGRTLNATVIDVRSIEKGLIEDLRRSRLTALNRDHMNEAIVELETRLERQRAEREEARIEELNAWHEELQNLAIKLNDLEEGVSTGDQGHLDLERKIEEYQVQILENDKSFRKRVLAKDQEALDELTPDILLHDEPPIREVTQDDPELLEILEDLLKKYDELIELSEEDRVTFLLQHINNLPNKSLIGEVVCESGWILNGMYTDPEIWIKIRDAGITIERSIIILEDDPYDHLIEKWRCNDTEEDEFHNCIQYENVIDNDDTNERKLQRLEKFIEDIKQFRINWEILKDVLADLKIETIICDLQMQTNILDDTLKQITNLYLPQARMMTEEDREEIYQDVDPLNGLEEEEEEGEEEENEDGTGIQKTNKDNRPFGDTGYFCPVALRRHGILWKGKDDLDTLFLNKVYLLSSEKALQDFLKDPYEFVPRQRPCLLLPPLRVSLVGPPGCGKTTMAKMLSKDYGFTFIDYFGCFIDYAKDRGSPIISRYYEDIFTVKDLTEFVQLPKDFQSYDYNTNKDIIKTFIRKYFEEGKVLPKQMLMECLLNFFKSPYNEFNALLESFPSCAEDVDAALENFALPEVIIELRCSENTARKRLIPGLFESWKTEQNARIMAENLRYKEELSYYDMQKEKWIKKRLKERRRERWNILRMDMMETEDIHEDYKQDDNIEQIYHSFESVTSPSVTSLLTLLSEESEDYNLGDSDEYQSNLDRIELEELWKGEYPEPVLFDDWESPDETLNKIVENVQKAYDSSSKNLLTSRMAMENENIPWIEVNGELDKRIVYLSILKILYPYIFRNYSMFERVQLVNPYDAESLLECGYYFLSSFGRNCPVQSYRKEIPFHVFLKMESQGSIFPVLHRRYIYFITGADAVTDFLEHPLKYLQVDSSKPVIPIRISIIGPPKCGKSTLAAHFCEIYGMKVITRGQSLRHLLEKYSWTESARLIESRLRNGQAATDELIARSVELNSIDPRSASQGLILDGFPSSQSEAEELAILALGPIIIIDLRADLKFCLERSIADKKNMRKLPVSFSPCYITHQHEQWSLDAKKYRNWLNKFSQNVLELDATKSKWSVWIQAKKEVQYRFFKIQKYFRNINKDNVHSLTYMCVSPYEFRERQSSFESYCPICLFLENTTNFSGSPPDHQGMVSFRGLYYWICPEHKTLFHKEPLQYLPPRNHMKLPTERAKVLDEKINIEHVCWIKRLKDDGFCLVSYVDGLPDRKLIPGQVDLGVLYKNFLYLFCSVDCRNKFVRQTSRYSSNCIHYPRLISSISLKSLPTFGYLEQSVATTIVRALNDVVVLRPKLAGITSATTAAIYLGTFLKIHCGKAKSSLKEISVYEEVLRRMEARREIMSIVINYMKKKKNPTVSAVCLSARDEASSDFASSKASIKTQLVSSVRFRRTSPTQNLLDPEADTWSICKLVEDNTETP
ncbi:adenylate kinase 9-like [Cephus cinctus]|uniref:Adenylate kinase 9-like n=1 Tax=Cephus cinctus TaxID=211228 RepID=A0AAJ7BPE1_CEPCN|nr:adenylate kinase 9-like [Cephus cinctus]